MLAIKNFNLNFNYQKLLLLVINESFLLIALIIIDGP